MNVLISSCDTGEGVPGTLERKVEKLRQLYELSDKKHALVSDPESADIILVVFIREDPWGNKILEHALINKFPGRCFSLTDSHRTLFLNHGVYASGVKSILSMRRVRTGSYTAYSDRYLNPYIRAHTPSARDSVGKKFLLCFVGRKSSDLRDDIFRLNFERRDILIEDSSAFDLWGGGDAGKDERQKYYYDMLLSSKFSLCPRGDSANSLRLFESMQVGVAPVIISDRWIYPKGPKWHEFSVIVKENHLSDLEKIVQSYETSYAEMGASARQAFETHFDESVYFNYIIENCVDIMRTQRIPEVVYWRLNPTLLSLRKAAVKLRWFLARAVRMK